MAINRTGNVVFIDAPGTGVVLERGLGRVAAVLVVGGTAAATLKLYADQAATATKQVFEGTAPAGEARLYPLLGSESDPGTLHTRDGFFADLAGAGSKAFIYLA